MVDSIHCLTICLFFDIPLFYCLNSTIICYLSSGDMHLFPVTSISLLASSFFDCKCAEEFFETLLSAILCHFINNFVTD